MIFVVQAVAAIAAFLVYGSARLRREKQTGRKQTREGMQEVLTVASVAGILPLGFAILYGAIVDAEVLEFLKIGGHRFFTTIIGLGVLFYCASTLVHHWPKK